MVKKNVKKAGKIPVLYLLKCAWHYSYERRKYFVVFILLSIIANIIPLFRPLIIGRVFNTVQFDSSDPNLLHYIAFNLGLLFLITLGFWLFHSTSRVMEENNSFFIVKNFKLEMLRRVMDLPAVWHKNHHSGDTIDKVNKAGNRLSDFASNIFQLVDGVVKLIGSIVILAFFDMRATLVLFFSSLLVVWFIVYSDKILKKYYDKIFKAENFWAAGIHDYISNIITVITLRLKKKAYREMEKRSMLEYRTEFKSYYVNEAKWATISVFLSMLTIVLLLSNAYSSYEKNGVIVLATLFILFQYLQSVTSVFFSFAWWFGAWNRQYAAVSASEVIIEEYNKVKGRKQVYLPENWHTIQIEKINFSYKNNNFKDKIKANIHNVSISIKRGERIALVGESGSGKSTLLSLLRGLHYTKKATVYADGKKLPAGLEHFYNHITLIPQDPELFNATVAENISMGYKVSKAEITESIKLARFDEVLARLYKGLKTNVMEKGVSLSGGEKQRLALARGLLLAKKYDFIFLDEPTSSVDSKNEIQIHENIFKHFFDKTIISSVHKLHLLPKFDYVYYFMDGAVIAEGTFKNILKDKEFKQIWDKYVENNRF